MLGYICYIFWFQTDLEIGILNFGFQLNSDAEHWTSIHLFRRLKPISLGDGNALSKLVDCLYRITNKEQCQIIEIKSLEDFQQKQ